MSQIKTTELEVAYYYVEQVDYEAAYDAVHRACGSSSYRLQWPVKRGACEVRGKHSPNICCSS